MRDEHPVAPFLRAVASYGLGGRTDPIAVPEGMWRRALSGLSWEKLTGLAAAALEAGDLSLSDEEAGELLERQEASMLHALTLERETVRLADACEDAGIDLIVLKGPALAHTAYPDPSWRPFGDLDVLVRSRDWRPACSLLPELGYRRKFPEPRPGFVERFGHTAAHVGEGDLEIDLHRTLVGGPFGLWMDPEELFHHTEPFELGGRKLLRLDDTALLMHACVHASLGYGHPLMLPLRDVGQVAEGEVDRDRLADWGMRWRLAVVYEHASRAASATLGAPGVWPAGSPARRRDRRALEAYTKRRQVGGKTLGSLGAIPGIRGKAAYAAALLFPSREFLRSRAEGAGRASYRRRWATPLRWLSARVSRRRVPRERETGAEIVRESS